MDRSGTVGPIGARGKRLSGAPSKTEILSDKIALMRADGQDFK
jgi:hypothetical protein